MGAQCRQARGCDDAAGCWARQCALLHALAQMLAMLPAQMASDAHEYIIKTAARRADGGGWAARAAAAAGQARGPHMSQVPSTGAKSSQKQGSRAHVTSSSSEPQLPLPAPFFLNSCLRGTRVRWGTEGAGLRHCPAATWCAAAATCRIARNRRQRRRNPAAAAATHALPVPSCLSSRISLAFSTWCT